jgi:hypothetical protein
MKITFETRRLRVGTLALCVRRSNGCAVDLAFGWDPKAKRVTDDERDAMAAADAVFRRYSEPYIGDLAAAPRLFESPELCGPYMLVETGVGEIGGMRVGTPGVYLIRDGRILRADAGALDEGSTDNLDIEIGGVVIAIEMYDRELDDSAGLLVSGKPIRLEHWPIAAADIQRRVTKIFETRGCRTDRADVEWAVNQAGFEYLEEQDRFLFKAVQTRTAALATWRAARDEAEDGLCR